MMISLGFLVAGDFGWESFLFSPDGVGLLLFLSWVLLLELFMPLVPCTCGGFYCCFSYPWFIWWLFITSWIFCCCIIYPIWGGFYCIYFCCIPICIAIMFYCGICGSCCWLPMPLTFKVFGWGRSMSPPPLKFGGVIWPPIWWVLWPCLSNWLRCWFWEF